MFDAVPMGAGQEHTCAPRCDDNAGPGETMARTGSMPFPAHSVASFVFRPRVIALLGLVGMALTLGALWLADRPNVTNHSGGLAGAESLEITRAQMLQMRNKWIAQGEISTEGARGRWITTVPAHVALAIHPGDKVGVQLDSSERVEGRVASMERASRSILPRVQVTVSLPQNHASELDSYAIAVFELRPNPLIVIDARAIQWQGGTSYVCLIGDRNRVHARAVSLGAQEDGLVEVSGLQLSQRVVVPAVGDPMEGRCPQPSSASAFRWA